MTTTSAQPTCAPAKMASLAPGQSALFTGRTNVCRAIMGTICRWTTPVSTCALRRAAMVTARATRGDAIARTATPAVTAPTHQTAAQRCTAVNTDGASMPHVFVKIFTPVTTVPLLLVVMAAGPSSSMDENKMITDGDSFDHAVVWIIPFL